MYGKMVTAFIVVVSLAFAGFPADAATHYLLGKSSVDGTEIAWGGSTTYSSQCASAISVWNAMGKISITPDTIWTVEDLTFSDVDSSSFLYRWAGYWKDNVGADNLYLNKYYMKSESSTGKQSVCEHELGHSLGLAHSISGNVMYSSSGLTTLGTQDKSDYSYLYP